MKFQITLAFILSCFCCVVLLTLGGCICSGKGGKELNFTNVRGDWKLVKIAVKDTMDSLIIYEDVDTTVCPSYLLVGVDTLKYREKMDCFFKTKDNYCYTESMILYSIEGEVGFITSTGVINARFLEDTLILKNKVNSRTHGVHIAERYYLPYEDKIPSVGDICGRKNQ